MTKKVSAYFTVEASMVLTLVIGVIVWLIYLMLYQYDRCLLDQDMGALALKGCSVQAEDKDALMRELEIYASQIDGAKYIAWDRGSIELVLKENKVRVEETGSLQFPFAGISLESEERKWESKSVFENRRISPVTFLRNYRKIMGGR